MSALADAMATAMRLLLPRGRPTPRHDDGHGSERQAAAAAKRARRATRRLVEHRRGGWR